MDNFRPKPIGLTPLEKCEYFEFLKFLFCCNLERRFLVLEYHKTHFPGLYCLKKYGREMANFEPKPWTNPFLKMSIIPHFEILVFL